MYSSSLIVGCFNLQCRYFADLTLHVHHTSFLILLVGNLVIMCGISIKPNKCCAINCRSRYTGENKDPDLTFHSFPLHDKQLFKVGLNVLQEKILR